MSNARQFLKLCEKIDECAAIRDTKVTCCIGFFCTSETAPDWTYKFNTLHAQGLRLVSVSQTTQKDLCDFLNKVSTVVRQIEGTNQAILSKIQELKDVMNEIAAQSGIERDQQSTWVVSTSTSYSHSYQ